MGAESGYYEKVRNLFDSFCCMSMQDFRGNRQDGKMVGEMLVWTELTT
mgnify:FL=1